MLDNLPDKKRMCHRCNFERSCFDLVTTGACERWVNVQGRHPQTGEVINRFNCIDDWHYLLMIENSKLLNETGAAIESFRNEMVVANERTAALMSHDLRRQLLEGARSRLLLNGQGNDAPTGAIEHCGDSAVDAP